MIPLLSARALACERDGRLLFEHLDLAVAPGDMLQVCGPNGSGKTSLLRLLSGLMQPSAGDITLNERPLWIGHAPGIKELLTAEENLAWLCALQQPAEREAIWTALARVGLRGYEDVACHALSAGQKRRVGLARLHLPGSRLWILDEPFTALDVRAVADLEEHLAQHCEAGGAVLLTTHHQLSRRPSRFAQLDLEGRSR